MSQSKPVGIIHITKRSATVLEEKCNTHDVGEDIDFNIVILLCLHKGGTFNNLLLLSQCIQTGLEVT